MNDLDLFYGKPQVTFFLKKRAQDQLELLLKTKNSITRVFSSYASNFPKKLALISELQAQIRGFSKGIPGSGGYIEHNESMGYAESVTNKEMCRNLWRKLAKVHHPDRGGNTNTFHVLRTAYENADLLLLQVMFEDSNATYRMSLDEFWVYAYNKASVNFQELKSREKYRIVQFHVSGAVSKAQQYTEQYLDKTILVLTQELHNNVEKQRKRSESCQEFQEFQEGK